MIRSYSYRFSDRDSLVHNSFRTRDSRVERFGFPLYAPYRAKRMDFSRVRMMYEQEHNQKSNETAPRKFLGNCACGMGDYGITIKTPENLHPKGPKPTYSHRSSRLPFDVISAFFYNHVSGKIFEIICPFTTTENNFNYLSPEIKTESEQKQPAFTISWLAISERTQIVQPPPYSP